MSDSFRERLERAQPDQVCRLGGGAVIIHGIECDELTPAHRKALSEYERAMREEVIPEIMRRMRENAKNVEAVRHIPLLLQAREAVQPIIDREADNENVGADVMDFVLR